MSDPQTRIHRALDVQILEIEREFNIEILRQAELDADSDTITPEVVPPEVALASGWLP